jgi:hypothetical protein
VNAIPTLHHLEIFALRERLSSRLRELNLRVPELPRLDAHHLEALNALIEANAILRSSAQSLRAGRSWLVGVLLSLIVALCDDPRDTDSQERNPISRGDQLERRNASRWRARCDSSLPNAALRFNKSCVLWARFLS